MPHLIRMPEVFWQKELQVAESPERRLKVHKIHFQVVGESLKAQFEPNKLTLQIQQQKTFPASVESILNFFLDHLQDSAYPLQPAL